MEIQKFRINRNLTGTTWTIPCTGTTNVWPMNTSTNCLNISVKSSTCKDMYNYLNGDINEFPEDLKECSPTTPCILLWDCAAPTSYSIPLPTNIKCSNLEGYNYVKFTGLKVTCTIDTVLNSYYENFEEISKIMTVYKQRTGITLTPQPQTTDCDCVNPLNDISHKVQIYLSQDFNDVGHYDLWDGNMSQQDLFSNFTISADSSGYAITLTNTMNYSYYDELAPFTYIVDWGDGLTDTIPSTQASITHPYTNVTSQRKVKLIQNTPWGPMTSSKLLTLPLNSYPQMFGQAYVPGNASNPGTGIGPNQINVSGMAGGVPAGSTAYHGRYPDFPLDSATDIQQFSGMSFTGLDCYVVTGVTESILGNFQSYTNQSDPNLPPGYLLNVWVPIGGDVINPLNGTFQTGMYGVITYADPTYTAYTVSSSFGATTNNADGDTPVTFYDMSNGITIFEADSCGLDKRAFGALACIECPEDDCEWCENKDEYYDRVDEVNIPLPTINNRQTWIPHPVVDYAIGDMVYDETFNSCCCFIAVKNITASDPWMYGKPPSISNEGKFIDDNGNEVHVWEACSYDCISCGLGTQTPCNDTTVPGYTGEVYGQPLTNFNLGDFVEDQHGNCYEAVAQPATLPPTASTAHWDYVGCVSWICPTDPAATECEMISGPQQGGVYGEMTYQGCMDNLNAPNGCFPPQYACPALYDCVGCMQIDATNPLYNTSSSFNSMALCVDYCNPIAWSCSTPTGSNCCYELSCDNTQSLYLSTVGTLGPTTTPASNGDLISFASTYDIYVEPYYDANDCQTGCCVNTSWSWSCGEAACTLTGGPPNGTNSFATESECETYILTQSFQYSAQGASNLSDIICGWTCKSQTIDCVYQPCEPCYFDSCGSEEHICNVNCSGGTMCGCWVCDCYQMTPACSLQLPCTASTLSESYLPSGYYVSSGDIFDSNGNYVAPLPFGPNPAMGTFTSSTECDELCICDTGWDCWLSPDPPPQINSSNQGININQGPNYTTDANGNIVYNTTTYTNPTGVLSPIGICTNPGSLQALQNLGYSYSQPPPFTGYTSFIECCENTGCCYASCDEPNDPYNSWSMNPDDVPYYTTEAISWGYTTANGFPAGTVTPCHWTDMYGPISGPCNDPASGLPYNPYWEWCNLDLCNEYAVISGATPSDPLECTEPPGECDCACGSHPDFSASTGGWNGSYPLYQLGDAVSWADADTDYCCFICVCVDTNTDWTISANITAAIGNQSMLDCNIMEPDLAPALQGLGNVVNCWESCNKTPGGSLNDPNDCDPCGSVVTYYECTPDGCVSSSCNDPSDPLCYTTSNCDGMCDASCFCNGFNNANCVDSCVTQEVYNINPFLFNFLNTCGPFSWTQGTENQCNTNLLSGALDCCGDDEQWYCDGSVGCSQLNLLQVSSNIGNGIGCVRVYPSDSQYETVLTNNYATQVSCQQECRWICDPNSTATCTFSLGAALLGSYPSAFSCYLSTIDCDCTNVATEWWCYDDQDPLSTNGGCISNTTWLNYTQSLGVYGQGQTQMVFGGTPFSDQASCEAQCRFCCDESGANGGFCEHKWGAIGCCNSCADYPTELDCSLNNSPYPCGPAGLYYCDLTVGCTQTPGFGQIAPGSGPTGTGDGWVLGSDCIAACAFDCGLECECEITLTPDYNTVTNYMSIYGAPFPTLVDCVVSTSNGDKCCDCDCFANNGSVSWLYYDPNTGNWNTQTSTANNLINPVPQWVSGTYLPTANLGDTVMHNGCCFIVLNTHTTAFHWSVSPTQAYNNYVNGMASSNPIDWPTYLLNFGNPTLYFPCDPNCVNLTASTAADWYCDSNINTNIPNCVQDTGIWTAPYSDNVFGQGVNPVSYTNNSNNGFTSQFDCEQKCRFCCVELISSSCSQCCRKGIGPQSLVGVTSASYYLDTTFPCNCNPGDSAVALSFCKQLPPFPPTPNLIQAKYIEQTNDTYLETYDNKKGDQGNQYRLLKNLYDEILIKCNNKPVGYKLDDTGEDCRQKLDEMKVKLDVLYNNLTTTASSPCINMGQCDPATEIWEGWLNGQGCCCCKKITSSSKWECELTWGDPDCLPSMYSCETLTYPCGQPDPCDCIGNTITWTMSPHEGTYQPVVAATHVPDTYLGMWYPNMVIPPSIFGDHSYVIDPTDGCCYSYSHHNGSGPAFPYGPIPPSDCYNNHLLGRYCDGSIYQWGVGNPFDGPQDTYPIWWACDDTCGGNNPCKECDATTPIWDISTQYYAGDKVLYPCTQPVVQYQGNTYCCFKLNQTKPIGHEPLSDGCEYWEIICGCDDKCPGSPDCDPPVPDSSWQCKVQGCLYLPGLDGFAIEQDCLDVCNEFTCTEQSTTAGTSKCNPSNSHTVISYLDSSNTTIPVDSPESFMNAFIQGNITLGNTNTIAITSTLSPMNYTYFNTQTLGGANNYQGCPDGSGGFRCSVDQGNVLLGWGGGGGGGGYGTFATTWNQLSLDLIANYAIDITGCDDFACAKAIVLNPLDPNNNSSVPFTTFEPATRPCMCSTQTLDCQCLLVQGTGHTNSWHMDDYMPCLSDCCDGLCSDCKTNLESGMYIDPSDTLIHLGLQSYLGSATYGYGIFDCITDPTNECCMCCVDNNLSLSPHTINGITSDCHIDLTSLAGQSVSIVVHDGQYIGTGVWVPCGVDENNNPSNCPDFNQ